MGAVMGDVLEYPFVEEKGLDVDPIYRRFQRSGPVKVQMAYGEPCWLATRYEDVRSVHVDRRFSKAAGIGRDIPRREGMDSLRPLAAGQHGSARPYPSPPFAIGRILGGTHPRAK